MSAIKIVGAQTYLQSVAGKTGPNVPNRATPLSVPLPGSTGVWQDVTGILSGGSHPEQAGSTVVGGSSVLPPLNAAEVKASDSVRGVFGGLRPLAKSTVAPGPAGGINQIRSRALSGWARLRARVSGSAIGPVQPVPPPSGFNAIFYNSLNSSPGQTLPGGVQPGGVIHVPAGRPVP